jgi:hypothetical protein
MANGDFSSLPLPAYAGGTKAITLTPVVGTPRRQYAEMFVPGAEALEDGELRVTVLGIGRTTDESSPAWPEPPRPPEGAPNVLIWVLLPTAKRLGVLPRAPPSRRPKAQRNHSDAERLLKVKQRNRPLPSFPRRWESSTRQTGFPPTSTRGQALRGNDG